MSARIAAATPADAAAKVRTRWACSAGTTPRSSAGMPKAAATASAATQIRSRAAGSISRTRSLVVGPRGVRGRKRPHATAHTPLTTSFGAAQAASQRLSSRISQLRRRARKRGQSSGPHAPQSFPGRRCSCWSASCPQPHIVRSSRRDGRFGGAGVTEGAAACESTGALDWARCAGICGATGMPTGGVSTAGWARDEPDSPGPNVCTMPLPVTRLLPNTLIMRSSGMRRHHQE